MKNNWQRIHESQDELLAKIRGINKEMDELEQAFTDGGTITFEQLEQITPKSPFLINGVSLHRLTNKDTDTILFYFIMPAGSYLTLHDHDCTESLHIVEGDVFINNEHLYPFDKRSFAPGQKHRLFTRNGSRLVVVFRQEKPA